MRRAELADQIDVTDIDAQFERRGRDEGAQLTALQALFRVETALLGQAAMVRCHRIFAETLAQVPRDAFGQTACIDEHQRRPMRAHEVRNRVVVLRPDLIGHHRFERRLRDRKLQVHRATMPFVDDRAVVIAADEITGDRLNRALRGRQADALHGPLGNRAQAFE